MPSAFCLLPSHLSAAPNVLFIAIDDLRPNLACYGDEIAITPNFDRLAAKGTLFNRAYCQLAVCAPSRLSLLSGRRPDTNKVWDLSTHFREALPNIVSLPQHFKNNGYYTRSIGKIYHGSGAPMKDPPSWSEEPIYDSGRKHEWRYASPENLAVETLKREASEGEDVPDNTFVDGLVCDAAEEALDTFKEKQQPFFLGVGFRKPHLPFVAPKKYWDLYDRAEIPRPVSNSLPRGAPEYATRTWHELEGYTDIPEDLTQLSEEKIQELRHGYYACISYVDALIGHLLDRLEKLELSDNTIVCLWGDHGFHLGEQGLWTKANNYELAARVPLILSVPGQANQGATSNAFVELVDLYPTLADVCGLDVSSKLEGLSMKPLLSKPNRPWKTATFNQYPRMFEGVRHEKHGDVMGYAVRTDRYRYVEWKEWESGKVVASELYDHQTDPEEMINIASQIDQAATVFQHQRFLEAGWKGALPLK
ncbi:MAG: sulfatase [Verrucomicrobia bacterium]|nr:sulfatase [Verrucomicrobiota bacterium]